MEFRDSLGSPVSLVLEAGHREEEGNLQYSALVAAAGPPGSALVRPEDYLLLSLLLFGLLRSLPVEFRCSQ